MKTIKKGIPPTEQIWRGECSACHSIFEAEEKELKISSGHQMGGDFGEHACLVCGLRVIFYPKDAR